MELGVNGKSKASGQTPYDVPGVRKSSGTTAAIFGVPEEILARTVFVLTEPVSPDENGTGLQGMITGFESVRQGLPFGLIVR